MKKIFFAALAMVAVLFASCEKIEPTAVNPESLNAKATVCGFVQYTYVDDGTNEVSTLSNQEVKVLYKMGGAYTEYTAVTNRDGFYTITLPAQLGKSINEVKVMSEYKGTTEAMNAKGNVVTTDAIFNGQATASPMAGQTTQLNLMLTAKVLLDEANLY